MHVASGLQPGPQPLPVAQVVVGEAIMHAVRTPLPEFDARRAHTDAAPVQRTRHLHAVKAFRPSRVTRIQSRPIFHRAALVTAPCTDPALARTRGEVGVRLRLGGALGTSFDPYLALQVGPE